MKLASSITSLATNVQLTPRDVQVIMAVHDHRVLRREQIQRLLFPSKNTVNERLKRLYQHGYLARRRLAVEYGQGSGQFLYLLARHGAQLTMRRSGTDLGARGSVFSLAKTTTPFLEHTLMVNDVRIAIELAARRDDLHLERWLREDELKRHPDHVKIAAEHGGQRDITLIPDAYFCLALDHCRAHFLLEADRATEANQRWTQKVLAYLAYVRSGAYTRRYKTHCLRVLTVTTSEKRMGHLLRTTEKAGGGRMFWFTSLDRVSSETVLWAPIWHVPQQSSPAALLSAEQRPSSCPSLSSAGAVLYRS